MARKNIDTEKLIIGVICIVLAVFFFIVIWTATHQWTFEGADEVKEKLAGWLPKTADTVDIHPVEGEVLYYIINCCGSGDNYPGPEKASRRFYESKIKSKEDIGFIAVLYFDRTGRGNYTNGAKAYSKDCTVYLIEADTLKIIASGKVLGGSVPSTTTGRDKYGPAPSMSECKYEAERLIARCNKQ